jgi:prepilin-type processing-associated H-X9-DG protein
MGAVTNTYMTVPVGNGDEQVAALPRHTAGTNFLFCDGHVRYLVGTQVSPGFNAKLPTSTATTNGGPWGAPTAEGTNGTVYAATFSAV